jgi:hypothetical protein
MRMLVNTWQGCPTVDTYDGTSVQFFRDGSGDFVFILFDWNKTTRRWEGGRRTAGRTEILLIRRSERRARGRHRDRGSVLSRRSWWGSQVFERGLSPVHVDLEGILARSTTRDARRTISTLAVTLRQTGHPSFEFMGELPMFCMLVLDLVGPLGPLGDLGRVPVELVPVTTQTILVLGQDLVEVVVTRYSGVVHLLHRLLHLVHLVLQVTYCRWGRLPQFEQVPFQTISLWSMVREK